MRTILRPEREGGQGLDAQQEESGNRAILALLTDPDVRDHVDLVITLRDDAYEVWAARGMLRFQRLYENGTIGYEVIEQLGENPLADQSTTNLATCAAELAAAHKSGHPTDDPNRAFIEPSEVSYPYAFERIAQLFDSPLAPDLMLSPKCYAFGLQAGQHGALDVVQSRAPLLFCGPGIRAGSYDTAPRHVDIAPTIAKLMGMPLIDGKDASGRTSSERGVAPDVYLQRQDGRVLREIVNESGRPERAYLILFDGLSHSELRHLIETDDPAIANLRRLLGRGALFNFGSTVNFPSITWPSHSTILTGAWCGHHDVINPTYYDRQNRQPLAPQGQGILTERFLGAEVETLYEAVRRVFGAEAFTASIHEPQGRGATHAALEQRVVGERSRLRVLTDELTAQISPRWAADHKDGVQREAVLDTRGLAQVLVLFDDPTHPLPIFVAHEFSVTDGAGHEYGPHSEGVRTAIAESDVRLGRILDMLESKGLFESTLFIFTSDHGMASQDVGLHANPARHPERIGMKAITGEPMIWLRDLHVDIVAAGDGRTARITVTDNDWDESGERPPVAGAEVLVRSRQDKLLAHSTTNEAGVVGVATPSDVPANDIVVAVHHSNYNSRHLRLDGSSFAIDLRRDLYGVNTNGRP